LTIETRRHAAAAVVVAALAGCSSSDTDTGPLTRPDQRDTETVYEVRDISEDVEAIRAEWQLPALAGATLSRTEVVALGASGQRNLDADPTVTTDDAWHLGGQTQAMTATLVATFVEDGTLHWETTLAEIWPSMDMATGYQDVTIEQLLSHHGGTTGNISRDHPDLWTVLRNGDDDVVTTRASFAADLLALDPSGVAGTLLYSDAGYTIVGAALEETTGSSWEDLMEQRLFEPLGMDGCGFGPPEGEQPWGHTGSRAIGPTEVLADNPAAMGPAGSVHCPLSGWAPFLQLHLAGAIDVETTILTPDSFERMHMDHGDFYGLGWGVADYSGLGYGQTLSYWGSNSNWYALSWLLPEKGRAYIATSNAGGDDAAVATEDTIAMLFLET